MAYNMILSKIVKSAHFDRVKLHSCRNAPLQLQLSTCQPARPLHSNNLVAEHGLNLGHQLTARSDDGKGSHPSRLVRLLGDHRSRLIRLLALDHYSSRCGYYLSEGTTRYCSVRNWLIWLFFANGPLLQTARYNQVKTLVDPRNQPRTRNNPYPCHPQNIAVPHTPKTFWSWAWL